MNIMISDKIKECRFYTRCMVGVCTLELASDVYDYTDIRINNITWVITNNCIIDSIYDEIKDEI